MRRARFFFLSLIGLLAAHVAAQDWPAADLETAVSPNSDRRFSDSFATRDEDESELRDRERAAKERTIYKWQQRIRKNPSNVASYRRLARALRRSERYDEGISVLEQALTFHPLDGQTYLDLGLCHYEKQEYQEAAAAFQRAVFYAPSTTSARRWLGNSLYASGRFEEAAETFSTVLRNGPENFDTLYWLGRSYQGADRPAEAAEAFAKAVALEPEDFEANYWRGMVLLRLNKFKEASASLEQADLIKPLQREGKGYLFAAYLAAGEAGKAFKLFPWIVVIIGGGLTGIYLLCLLILGWFSFRAGRAAFPPLWLSLFWIAVMFEGQIAFTFMLGAVPTTLLAHTAMLAILLPTLPVMLAALFAFRRPSWGEAFRWPLRFGGMKAIALGALFLFLSFGFNLVVTNLTSSGQRPVQNSAVFLKDALTAYPVLAVLTIVLAVPLAEEILFRGLLFGALTRWLRTGWILVLSSTLFAAIHFDLAFFLPLFFLGMVLGWARIRSRSLGLPLLIHTVNNGLALLALTARAGQ